MRLEQDLRTLNRNINKTVATVNQQAAKAINRQADKARREATKIVAKEIGVAVKTLKGRTRQSKGQRATARRLQALLQVNTRPLPLIRLLESPRNKIWEGSGAIMVGKYAVKRGFKQTLANGRTHILQRQGKSRYPIDVVKIPLAAPLTQAYRQALKDYPQAVQQQLKQGLKAVFS